MDEARETRERFAAVVGRWLPGVYAYFRKLGLSEAAAEDLAQETFLAAWRNLPSLRDPEKMRSWLYGTAYRHYLRHRRKRAAPLSLETAPEAAPQPEHDPGSDHSLARRALQEAVLALPDRYRQPLVLLYWEDLSYEEAARALSIPLGTLAWRARKALQLVRHTLAEERGSHERDGERRSAVAECDSVGDA